jgi:trehalose 6-phosphate synthase/phosphatase
VATPTHGDHSKLESKISEAVSHINGTYGSLEFTPVHYYHQDIDRDEYYALLSVADLALITCSRDGMNTTSYEYILCQHNKPEPGQLILSEFAGTAGSLGAAILVNPWDFAGVARNIEEALTMPIEEKITRHEVFIFILLFIFLFIIIILYHLSFRNFIIMSLVIQQSSGLTLSLNSWLA